MARAGAAAVVAAASTWLGACVLFRQTKELAEVVAHGESRTLRKEEDGVRTALTERRHDLLIVALDGVDRDLLYAMLRRGELPGLAKLLGGGQGGRMLHAHLDDHVLSVMPSTTMPAWASLFTAVPPSVHGVTGNEFFIREKKELAAPIPVSFTDATPVLKCYSDDYADDLLEAPTIYEQIRARDPGVRIWVSMSQFHGGADRLLTANRTVLAQAFTKFLERMVAGEDDKTRMAVYASLDGEVLDTIVDELGDEMPAGEPPDVLTLYLAGTDLFAHQAEMGPDPARRLYMTKVLDPKLGALHDVLSARRALDDRFVVVISDHGHTDVDEDDRHALGSGDEGEPPAVLHAAGFRVRPFTWKVDDGDDYQAVLAYGGATAYVYLADRSRCPERGQACDFRAPPRFEEDVLPVAEAFFRSSRTGQPVAGMKNTIDLVLTRRPRPAGEKDLPFQVYAGDGRLEDVSVALGREGRQVYVDLEERLRELGAGPRGDRAGDILLITRDGAERRVEDRYYFSGSYQSWHGSPSRKDSEVPFILAHPRRSPAELAALARRLGSPGGLPEVGRLLVKLRLEDPGKPGRGSK